MASVGITTVVRVPVRLKPDDGNSGSKKNPQATQSLVLEGPVVISTLQLRQLPGASEESDLNDESDDASETGAGNDPDGTAESALPNLTLTEVIEQQGVVLVTSEDADTASTEVIVAVDISDAPVAANATTLVSGDDIEALYANATLDQPGSGSQSNGSNILLLKSGWAFLGLSRSPLEFPAEPPANSPSQNWSPWRQTVEGLHEIQDVATGIWSALRGTLIDTSPKTTEQSSGAYQSTEVSSNINGASTTWRNLDLAPGGVFSVSNSTLVSGGHLNPDNSYILQVSNSVASRSRSFSGTASSAGGASASIGFQKEQLSQYAGDLFGTWEILEDGVTLELRYADGRVERQLFLQAQDGESLSIDGSSWWRDSDVAPDLLQRRYSILTDPDNARPDESWASVLAKVELELKRVRSRLQRLIQSLLWRLMR